MGPERMIVESLTPRPGIREPIGTGEQHVRPSRRSLPVNGLGRPQLRAKLIAHRASPRESGTGGRSKRYPTDYPKRLERSLSGQLI